MSKKTSGISLTYLSFASVKVKKTERILGNDRNQSINLLSIFGGPTLAIDVGAFLTVV